MTTGSTLVSGRIILLGAPSVGKTCLVRRLVKDFFDANTPATIGYECATKLVQVDDQEVKLFLYDTAGQERFAKMTASYFRTGDLCLLCFDLTHLSSFESVQDWMDQVKQVNPTCLFLLVGCKKDLLAKEADLSGVTRFADQHGMAFFQTSSLEGGSQVDFLLQFMGEKLIRQELMKEKKKATAKPAPKVVHLNPNPPNHRSNRGGGGCC